jgi:hypothetical protein
MAINISDSLHAAGNVLFTTPGTPAFGGQNGFLATIIDAGPGDFTVSMDQQIDATARVVTATASGALAAFVTVENVDDASFRVRTWDAAGAPLDNVPVSLIVHRHSL